METLGSIIYRKRAELSLSQSELAELIGVTRTEIWFWETDKRKPYPKNIRALSSALGIPLAELVKMAKLGG